MRHSFLLRMSIRRVATVALSAAAGISASFAVHAEPATPPNEAGLLTLPNVRVIRMTMPSPAARLQLDGMKAFIDAESGTLTVPTFEQLDELQRVDGHRKPEPKALDVRRMSNGALKLRAPSSMINLSVARLDASGKVAMACTPADGVAQVFHVTSEGAQ